MAWKIFVDFGIKHFYEKISQWFLINFGFEPTPSQIVLFSLSTSRIPDSQYFNRILPLFTKLYIGQIVKRITIPKLEQSMSAILTNVYRGVTNKNFSISDIINLIVAIRARYLQEEINIDKRNKHKQG